MLLRFMELFRSIILARLLQPEVLGLIGILSLLRHGIQQFTQMGFDDSIIYRKSEIDIDKSINTAWILNIIHGRLLFMLLYFLSPLTFSFYGEDVLNRHQVSCYFLFFFTVF